MTDLIQGTFPSMLQDPFADDLTQPFWDAAAEGRLSAPQCTVCGTFVLPPQPFCFACQSQAFEWVDLPGTGTIYTYTVVRHPLAPQLADVVPYVSGVIELDGTQGAGRGCSSTSPTPTPRRSRSATRCGSGSTGSPTPCRCPGPGWPEATVNEPKPAPAARAGRPRRFEAEDELRILLDAALAVMERNGYVDAAVADILREAKLSTRSFYRHFESKDQLLCALFRREAEAAATRLNAKVDAASDPHAALDAWIEEILSFGHHRTKAARVSVLGSPGAMKAEGYADEMRHASKLLLAPLEALLAAGAADGSFPLADPAADAPLIQSVVWAAAGLNPTRDKASSRAEATRQVRSFCARALGCGPGR